MERGGQSTYAYVGGSEGVREMNRSRNKKEKDEKCPQECRR